MFMNEIYFVDDVNKIASEWTWTSMGVFLAHAPLRNAVATSTHMLKWPWPNTVSYLLV